MEKEHLAWMVRERIPRFGSKTAMRHRDAQSGQWRETSWTELGELVQAVARALLECGVKEEETVGIFSQNRPEWSIADYGIQSVRAVSVPIYATNSTAQAQYIVDNAGIRVLFVDSGEQTERAKAIHSPSLERIVVFGDHLAVDDARLISFKDFLKLGSDSRRDAEIAARLDRATTQDIATIIYTSGTTGDPKGVMLTHSNFFHQFIVVGTYFSLGEGDVSLCFLPLSHVFERAWSYYVFHRGAVNCYCDNPKQVMDYIAEAKPTAMVAVPRLYEKVHAAISAKLATQPERKQKLFGWAVAVGKRALKHRCAQEPLPLVLRLQYFLADRLILQKLRNLFGGRMRCLVSGGAALPREIGEFFGAAGMLICEGYGLTETSPTITCNQPCAFKFGTVGKVVPRCEVRLGDDGEILVRGDNVTPGYYKNPEATAQAFSEGWFRTGDVGEFDAEGFLRITDRIKDLIITSGGKNISPQNVQACLLRDEFIEQAVVIGDGRQFLSALIVPAFEPLEQYARSRSLVFHSREELVEQPAILDFYAERIARQSAELGDYEKVKKFRLLPHEFTQESGEMTPTLKIKRKVIHQKYANLIEGMYAQSPPKGG